jgi:hypothetical protein
MKWMAFITASSRNARVTEPVFRSRWLLCLLLTLLWSSGALARNITVESVASRIEDGQFIVDARLAVRLNANTSEALENGVTLEFELESRLLRPRRFWWDAQVTATKRRFLLSRHALADGYTLSEPDAEHQQTFKDVDAALAALGDVRHFIAGDAAGDKAVKKYRGRLRLRLDIEALPAPLRPIAYVSPGWRLSSGWYEWVFVP